MLISVTFLASGSQLNVVHVSFNFWNEFPTQLACLFQQYDDVENKTAFLSKDLRFFTGYKMASESSTQSKTEIDSK